MILSLTMQQEFEYSGMCMGTSFSIAIVCKSHTHANTHASNAIARIREYETRFSRFLPQSELSILNKQKTGPVSHTFMQVIREAYRLFTMTHGIFNPLVQIDRFGYDKNFDEIQNVIFPNDISEYNIDFTETHIDVLKNRVVLALGQKLDFGGFLKGYLATLLAQEIINDKQNVTGVVVNIGGDIHTEGCDADGNDFVFHIYNPITKKDDRVVSFRNASIATSGTYKRAWKLGGMNIHHILDATGIKNPDSGVVSASVLHTEGSVAEAFATVFLSVGPAHALTVLGDVNIPHIVIMKNGITHISHL